MTHAREPETIEGAREPRGVRAETLRNRSAAQRSTGPGIKPGTRAFVFVAAKYLLQLTSPQDERLPDGRMRHADRAKKVVSVPAALGDKWKGLAVLDTVKQKDVIDMLLEHPSYGVDFVDYADILETSRQARVQDAALTLVSDKEAMADPTVRAALKVALAEAEGEDFDSPLQA